MLGIIHRPILQFQQQQGLQYHPLLGYISITPTTQVTGIF